MKKLDTRCSIQSVGIKMDKDAVHIISNNLEIPINATLIIKNVKLRPLWLAKLFTSC